MYLKSEEYMDTKLFPTNGKAGDGQLPYIGQPDIYPRKA